jgi:hypothetical protein
VTAIEATPAPTEAPAGTEGVDAIDPRTERWAAVINRYVWDRHGPVDAALRLQAEDDIRGAFAAVDQLQHAHHLLDQLRVRHAPVPIAAGERYVCAATRKHPESCPDCVLLWGDDDQPGGLGGAPMNGT